MSNIEKINKLEKNYPEMFDKCFDFSIGEGWIPLIKTICSAISSKRKTCIEYLELSKNPENEYYVKNYKEYKENFDLWNQDFKFIQIKEKFGFLRIYAESSNEEIDNWIQFAEMLSKNICPNCGKNTEVMKKGWIGYYCIDCGNKLKEEGKEIINLTE